MNDRLSLETTDGVTLEARWDSADDPKGAVVLCHAHPLQGGTMTNPLMIAVMLRLLERGFSVLRFNFRGVGESTGEHGQGTSELLDIDAAYTEAAMVGVPIGVAGWSFGAGTSLRWLAERDQHLRYVGIAPAAAYFPENLPVGPKRIIVGTRDQVIDIDPIIEYSTSHSIDVVLTPGDHFFHGRGKRIGELVAQGFE